MIRFRGPLALLLSALVLIGISACSPFGGDDDDDPAPRPPTATREVVMSTFTPTEVVPPDQQTATADARNTAAAQTATERGNLPTPTLAASIAPEDILYPPRARLETGGALVDSYLGSYSWQFSDQVETFGGQDAPIVVFDAEPAPIENGEQLSLRYFGDEYRIPPQLLEVAVYDFESNSAVPIGQTGQQADEPAFSIRTDPVQNLRVDPADPTFTLDGFEPGHYVIWAQGHWGQHPVFARPLFVTWIFNIEIVE